MENWNLPFKIGKPVIQRVEVHIWKTFLFETNFNISSGFYIMF